MDSVVEVLQLGHGCRLLDDGRLGQVEYSLVELREHLVAGEGATIHDAIYAHLSPYILLRLSWSSGLGRLVGGSTSLASADTRVRKSSWHRGITIVVGLTHQIQHL